MEFLYPRVLKDAIWLVENAQKGNHSKGLYSCCYLKSERAFTIKTNELPQKGLKTAK